MQSREHLMLLDPELMTERETEVAQTSLEAGIEPYPRHGGTQGSDWLEELCLYKNQGHQQPLPEQVETSMAGCDVHQHICFVSLSLNMNGTFPQETEVVCS